ncbi:MAG: hypothetical protein U0N15_09770 [Bifidobacterium choerinum]
MIMVILKAMTSDGTIHTWQMLETDARHCLDDSKPLPNRVPAFTIDTPIERVFVNPHQFLQWELHHI